MIQKEQNWGSGKWNRQGEKTSAKSILLKVGNWGSILQELTRNCVECSLKLPRRHNYTLQSHTPSLLLYNKLSTKLAENNRNLLSLSDTALGVEEMLSWEVLDQCLSRGLLSGHCQDTAIIWTIDWGWRILPRRLTHAAMTGGLSSLPYGPLYRALQCGHNMTADFPQHEWSERTRQKVHCLSRSSSVALNQGWLLSPCPPLGHLAMFGDIFGCDNWLGGAISI